MSTSRQKLGYALEFAKTLKLGLSCERASLKTFYMSQVIYTIRSLDPDTSTQPSLFPNYFEDSLGLSSPNMATPGKEKIMSSRLSTMKFMQRTAAPAPQSAPSTPESRPAKRPRLSEPSRLRAPDPADEQIRDVALEGERKRQQALDKQATDAGDSKWYLDLPEDTHVNGFKVVNAGYTLLDSPRDGLDDGEDEVEATPDVPTRTLSGRKSFGNFNKVIEVRRKHDGFIVPHTGTSSCGCSCEGYYYLVFHLQEWALTMVYSH